MSLTCSLTCTCVAFGFSKTALAFARPSSTSAWRAFMESRVRFANKASRVPWVDLAAVLAAVRVDSSRSFISPTWGPSWPTGAGLDLSSSCSWFASSALVPCAFSSPAGLPSAGCSSTVSFRSPSSDSCGFPSEFPEGPATTSLAVAEDIAGACACTPFAKNINAATATLAAPKWYLRIE